MNWAMVLWGVIFCTCLYAERIGELWGTLCGLLYNKVMQVMQVYSNEPVYDEEVSELQFAVIVLERHKDNSIHLHTIVEYDEETANMVCMNLEQYARERGSSILYKNVIAQRNVDAVIA